MLNAIMSPESAKVRLKTTSQIWTDITTLTVLCLFTRLPWLFMVPMVEAPDEFSHYWVVKFLVEHAQLPNRSDVFAGGPSAVYGSLPQLGYLPHVFISKLLPFWDLTITARLGSLAMGVVLVIASYLIAIELYKKTRWECMALPLVILFHPQMVLLHAYINSDSTAAAAAALILLLVIRMINRGLSILGCSAVGFLSGWAALSKYAALSVVLSSGFGLIVAGWLNGASISLIVAACGTMISVFALTCNWWFMRELQQYPGDMLGTKTMRQIWAQAYNRPLEYQVSIWSIVKNFHHWWRPMYFSFWGDFGYMTRHLPKPLYIVYFLYTLAATAGGLLGARYVQKFFNLIALMLRVKNNEDVPAEELDWLKSAAIYLVFSFSIIANLSAMIWSSSLNLGGPQGRYLFGCEVPIIALTISGLFALNKKHGWKFVVSFVCFNIFVYVWSFSWLYNIYGGFRTKMF